MNAHDRHHKRIALGMAGALLLGVSAASLADDNNKDVAPMALRKIMQDMGKNMQVMTDGISRSDWKLVEKAAAQVADHAQPPAEEKARIIGLFGAEMGRFKGYDTQTHDHATAAGVAARAADGAGVIRAFGQLQTSCWSCHTAFREPFLAHFYGKKPAP